MKYILLPTIRVLWIVILVPSAALIEISLFLWDFKLHGIFTASTTSDYFLITKSQMKRKRLGMEFYLYRTARDYIFNKKTHFQEAS